MREIPFDALKVAPKRVGKGGFANVFQGEWNNGKVAVKMLLLTGDVGKNMVAKISAEAELMRRLSHPNVVTFYGVCTKSPNLCVVTEFCERGSLYDVLQKAAYSKPTLAKQLNWKRRLGMAVDAAAGMSSLHEHGVLHRDLKGSNLLITGDWTVKVADFGLSKHEEAMTSQAGTMAKINPKWLAPEILCGGRGSNATQASDVYAFGVVMWELLAWRLPWMDVRNDEVSALLFVLLIGLRIHLFSITLCPTLQIKKRVIAGKRLPVPAVEELLGPLISDLAALEQYKALMERCWAQEPARRPSFEDVVKELKVLLARPEKRVPKVKQLRAPGEKRGSKAGVQKKRQRPASPPPGQGGSTAVSTWRSGVMARALSSVVAAVGSTSSKRSKK